MAGTALRGRLSWIEARVSEVIQETESVRTITFHCPGWPGHRAGQHVDVRLTAPDGYQAQRSYSIASAPAGEQVAVTVERLEDGEVSTYLAGELRVGDVIELRGPIGGYFVWEPSIGGPVMLIAGGSGVVPLMAMLRVRKAVGSDVPVRLLYSSRSWDRVIYRDELDALGADPGVEVRHTITGAAPPGGLATRAGSTTTCWPSPHGPSTCSRWYTCAARPAWSKPRRRPWWSSGTIQCGSARSGSARPGGRRDRTPAPRRKRAWWRLDRHLRA